MAYVIAVRTTTNDHSNGFLEIEIKWAFCQRGVPARKASIRRPEVTR